VGFHEQDPGAFALTYAESEYLQARLLSIERSAVALRLPRRPLQVHDRGATPLGRINRRARAAADQERRDTCSDLFHDLARRNLLYNYLVARKYEQDGWTTIENPVECYGKRLDTWATELRRATHQVQAPLATDLGQARALRDRISFGAAEIC